MTNHYGVDEDWSRLSPAELLAAGKTFVVGYVSEDTTGKNITPAEVQAYHAAGVAVLLVYEYSVTAVQGGAAKGHHDATIAIASARALGYPAGRAIGFAVDENTSANPGMIDDYCRAFTADVHGAGWRSMAYGGLATVKRCADLGLTDLTWQTYAWSGSPTTWDGRAAIRQYQNHVAIDGKYIDLDVAVVDDYGAWLPNGATTMTLAPDELDLLRQCNTVLGTAYAKSKAAGDDPVQDIGAQVFAIRETLKQVALDAKAAANLAPVPFTDAQAADFTAKVTDQVTAGLAAIGEKLDSRFASLERALGAAIEAAGAVLNPPAA